MNENRPPLPPFADETAVQKVRGIPGIPLQ